MGDQSHNRRTLTEDMFEDVTEAGLRRIKSIDGANTFSAAWLGTKGIAYVVDWVNDPELATGVPGNTKVYANFTTPATKWMIIEADAIYTDSPALVLSIYNDYTAVEGASIPIFPLKAGQPSVDNIPTESTLKLVTGTPTINPASRVAGVGLFSTSSGNTGGSSGGNSFIRLLPPGSSFLVELHNRNNNTHYVQQQIVWAEIPESYLPKLDVV